MEFDYSKLRGRIIELYGSVDRFLEEDRTISKTTFHSRMRCETFFTQKEIKEYCERLQIKPDEISSYFFTRKVG